MPEPGWDDPEVFVDAIVGWRAWHLRRTTEGPTLVPAATRRGEWPARRALVARCRKVAPSGSSLPSIAEHPSPDRSCTCGVYASDTLRSLVAPPRRFPPLPVLGTVSLWGRVIEHARGWRAEFAYPDRLRLVCGVCLSAGDGSGIPDRVVEIRPRDLDGPPEIEPLCAEHLAMRARGTRILRRADDVQAELLSRYAVDLLPFQAIEGVFQRRPVPGPTRTPAATVGTRPAAPVIVPRAVTSLPVVPTREPAVHETDPAPVPGVPARTRVLEILTQVASAIVTVAFWLFMAWWGCGSMIVTVNGP
jgi:hypothetical protein